MHIIKWHGNIPCAIDFETTGLNPQWNEIWQVAIVPLTEDLLPHPELPKFYEHIAIEHPERVQPEAAKVSDLNLDWLAENGAPAGEVSEWLQTWWRSLDLPIDRKVIPVAHNWAFESSFLDAWLGQPLKEQMFHYHARDTAAVCGYLRDRNVAELATNDIRLSLMPLCEYFGVKNDQPHNALGDALACAELYRKLVLN